MGKSNYREDRPHSFSRLFVPRGFAAKGYKTQIKGIAYGKVEINGQMYAIEMHGLKNPGDPKHRDGQVGYMKVVQLVERQNSRGL